MKILIIFLSGLGNMILFLPTLQVIRNTYPNAEITLWPREIFVYELIKNSNLVDKIVPYYHKNFKNLFKQTVIFLKLRKEKYDIIINTFFEKGYKAKLFTRSLRAKRRLGYKAYNLTDLCYSHLLTFNSNEHESDIHFKIATFLSTNTAIKPFQLSLPDEKEEFAKEFLKKNNITKDDILVGLHPGCSEFASNKRWPIERFAGVADTISQKYKAKIIIFGGKEEIPLSRKVITGMNISKPISLVGETTILQTAAVIKKCNLLISSDSGLMHLASAVATPLVAIFGPTSPTKNRPFGKESVIIKKDLSCSPCYPSSKCKNRVCLSKISVDDVVATAEKILNRRQKGLHEKQHSPKTDQ